MTNRDDYRSFGAHDCDRILYSSAYRRLTGVTQVVAVGERQLFHNRLTHTQKVAQLSRRIAQYLNFLPDAQDARAAIPGGAVDVDVAEAAGLAHDLGHPPFGHIAEKELQRLCSATDRFEGNAQSFRIVTKLSQRRTARGLELSPRTLRAILKYPWLSNHAHATEKKKWGAYRTEEDEFLVAMAGDTGTEQSVEASIMDWADDISYAVHDLEDFYRAGLIDIETLRNDTARKAEFVQQALEEWHEDDWSFADAATEFDSTLELLPPRLARFDGTVDARKNVNRLGSELIERYVSGTGLNDDGTLNVPAPFRREVHFLKQFTWQFVINDPSLASLQNGQVRVIQDLFHDLCEWNESEKRKQRLPTRFRDLLSLAEERESGQAASQRAAADYISSLTEEQAYDLHGRFRGAARASIRDGWVAY